MADIWDSANLRRKFLNKIRRPSTDEDLLEPDGVTDATWDLLSEAQDYWVRIIASTYPEALYGDPVLLTTADAGKTYSFGNDTEDQPIFPIGHVEVRESRTGRLLIPSTDWGSGDFVMEGNKIRIPGNRTKLFSAGPYARFVSPPTKISAAVQPVIKPGSARILIVLRAAITWANQGGLRDPSPWAQEEAVHWGTIANAYRTQFHLAGAQAVDDGDDDWWHNIDTGADYVRWSP
jgi:hypothetical protein